MRKETGSKFNWSGNVEVLEERVVMSADPLANLLGVANEPAAAVDQLPLLSQHQVVDGLPSLSQHVDDLPPLQQNGDRDADFWIDYSNVQTTITDEIGRVEQALANAHNQTGLTQVRNNFGFDGGGQTVAVIDSGIAYDHFALGGGLGSDYRVVGGYDFTAENDADPYDDGPSGSHGTHVAGIVGASGGTHEGVAPGVDLVGLRVFDDAGNGFFSWVEDALQWAYDNRNAFENPITTVNLSLGVASYNADAIPAWANLEDEFAQLEQAGIFISVSAGNSFNSFNTTGLSYPAASPHVVPVASVNDAGNLSSFSQRNSRVLAAPGQGIFSTVPDYRGNNDGITNDYASFSGTSMAAPYVAGASVIVREAFEFIGTANITQDLIYDHLVSTADSVYDSATDAYYNRLNLEAAIEALIPEDEFGSSIVSAFDLGSLSGDSSLGGSITTLDDADFFKFTASETGTVTFTAASQSHDLVADWEVSGGTGTWGDNGTSFTIDVVAGQEYTVGLSSQEGLGHYELDITSEGSGFTFTDWGAVSFSHVDGISNSGETWYRVVAENSGFFTAQAFFDASAGQVELELYNSSQQSIGFGGTVDADARVNGFAQAGDELFLKVIGDNSDIDFQLTNLVSISGQTVTVNGTAGDDTFAFTAGSTHDVEVNGVNYLFTDSAVSQINFHGSGGSDSISVVGTSADETAVIRVGTLDFTSTTFSIDAISVENISVNGGGGQDIADLYDSIGDDTFVATPTTAQFTGNGFANTANNFSRVNTYASSGGYDLAIFHDSVGDDRFVAHAQFDQAYLYGDGYLNFAQGFDRTEAYATAGGHDRSYLYDSEGNDRFISSPEYNEAYIYGAGFLNYANGFDRNYAYATAGGLDRADYYDSSGDDTFVTSAQLDEAYLSGDGFLNYTNGFYRNYAFATEGGNDRAYFYDSAGDDRYISSGQYDEAYLHGDGFINYAKGFDRTDAFATAGGHDRAYFYDSDGDDRFVSSAQHGDAYLHGDGFLNYANGFDRNYAYATEGGTKDRADFYDSAGDDIYVTNAETGEAYLVGGGFLNYANGFERNFGFAIAGGTDVATFYDSLGNDTYTDHGTKQNLFGNGRSNNANGFEQVDVHGSQGYDVSNIDTIYATDSLYGDGNLAQVTRSSSHQNIYDFDKVSVTLDGAATSEVDESTIDYIYEELGA